MTSLTQKVQLLSALAVFLRFVDDPLGVRRTFRPDLRFGPDEV